MHEGHRRRMYEKLKNNDRLYEHELLEMLLFNAYARKNTNPIAHALLDAFGSIAGVLNAEVEELTKVNGVGENVALYLKCIGACTAGTVNKSSGVTTLKGYGDFKNFTALRLRGKTEEVLELYCLDKVGKVTGVHSFTSNASHKVEVMTDEVAGVIASAKPYGLIIAHNHLSGNPNPSENDDRFTMEVQVMCSFNNVVLHDHCIYAAGCDVFSYFLSGKIDDIKNDFDFRNLVDAQYLKHKTEKNKF